MYYIITDIKGNLEARFFSSRQEAEDFQEENYYLCTGDVREVPGVGALWD